FAGMPDGFTLSIGRVQGLLHYNVGGNDVTFTVTQVQNAPPTIALRSIPTINEDSLLTFSQAGGKPIVITDPDSGNGTEVATFSVLHGVLTAGSTLNVVVGGNNTGTLTITGSVAAINAA